MYTRLWAETKSIPVFSKSVVVTTTKPPVNPPSAAPPRQCPRPLCAPSQSSGPELARRPRDCGNDSSARPLSPQARVRVDSQRV